LSLHAQLRRKSNEKTIVGQMGPQIGPGTQSF